MSILRLIILSVLLLTGTAFKQGQLSFEEAQQKNERVRQAYQHKKEYIRLKCHKAGIPEDSFGNMLIRVFKAEGVLEIWVQRPDGKFVKFDEYRIYAQSGKLGPKRMQGDCQVPEGYYYINDFNPISDYYLSLGINYPNESDRKLSTAVKKGGDIYIHGKHASAGCLAMSDFYIEDIYICAVKARNYGQREIPVEIFPFKPTPQNFVFYSKYIDVAPFTKFWKNLAQGYVFFEKSHRLPKVTVDQDGYYQFSDSEIAAK